MDDVILSPAQCVIARNLLGWGIRELAAQAKVSHVTIVGFEKGQRRTHASTRSMLRQALEAGGVEFIQSEATDEHAKVASVSLDDGSIVKLRTVSSPE